jgi:hypothetical protein
MVRIGRSWCPSQLLKVVLNYRPLPPIMIAVIVIAMLPPFSVPVTVMISVPTMVVIVVAAWCRPVALEVAATLPVGFDPIRIRERRTCPVAVVPCPAPVDGIPISLDPLILRGGLRRNPIDPGWWGRRPEGEAERYLRVSCGRGEKQQAKHNCKFQ